ncbi:MAG: ribosome small subunit-dependent GTPase A [Oscillospiraceae bacterium]|nr:ribosome small subunit-dependent GTPase A [Oscillospiraceae bacterium]
MIDIQDYGFEPSMLPVGSDHLPARVTAVHRQRYEIVCKYGFIYARLKSANYYTQNELFPIVGDFVLIQYESSGDSLIVQTLPRKSIFSRRDPGPRPVEQPVAANFDIVFVMTSLNQDLNLNRLERYLTLTWQSGALPVIVLTKSDLVDDYSDQIARVRDVSIGIDVIAVSSVTGYGLDQLKAYLKPRVTTIFLGSSGVGKSSLLNALAGESLMKVNSIREQDSRGRHTTTHRELFMLQTGAMIIDTPGMRELGMWDIGDGLASSFGDVEEILQRHCRFADCKHRTEPGCAVKEALADGELAPERWNNYLKLKREAEYIEKRNAIASQKAQKSANTLRKERKDEHIL